jgi:hypothetical protein
MSTTETGPDTCTSVYINPKDDGGGNGGGGDDGGSSGGSIVDKIRENPLPVIGIVGAGAYAYARSRGGN